MKQTVLNSIYQASLEKNKNREGEQHIFMDNRYTAPQLFCALADIGLRACGTIQKTGRVGTKML